jgi:adenylate cyclase
MTTPSGQRLAAVLMADIAGYTRLVESDTAGTVAAWQACRDRVIEPTVAQFGGQIVKLTGDGFLAEFSSVQRAVDAALEMQRLLAEHPLDFRMGVNFGDIVDDGRDIHGEGVNIAARIEAMAPDGGICITGTVHDAVRNRIATTFQDLGEHPVKHVSNPVRVWQWPAQNLDSVIRGAQERVELPDDTPSIAVLPFAHPSEDSEQADFIDGMTEDLITDLSKISGLFVVARQSSFAYRDRGLSHQAIARELGVRYLLLGKLRRSGSRVRINAQLVDSHNGNEVWAERYDGSLEDVFELQDEVCAQVVEALSVKLSRQESANLRRVHTANLDAYELFVQARSTPYPPIPERIFSARDMFARVIELDPAFAGGYAGVAAMLSFINTWGSDRDSAAIREAIELAEKACSVDDSFGWSHVALGVALLANREHDASIEAILRGIEREPNDAEAHAMLSLTLCLAGRYDEAGRSIDQSIRLNPQFVYGPYLNIRGIGQLLYGNCQAAVASFQENENRQGPVGPPALGLHAAALQELGRQEELELRIERLKQRFPAFRLQGWIFPDLIVGADVRERVLEQMQKAGVPP